MLGSPFADPRLIVSNDVSTEITTAVPAIVSDSDQLMSAILPVKGIAATNEPAPVRSARSARSITKLPDVIAVAVDTAKTNDTNAARPADPSSAGHDTEVMVTPAPKKISRFWMNV